VLSPSEILRSLFLVMRTHALPILKAKGCVTDTSFWMWLLRLLNLRHLRVVVYASRI
jgi:hypothetical protein